MTALHDRVSGKTGNGLKIYSVYYRNNKNDDKTMLRREFVKEVPRFETNKYVKLANIAYDAENDRIAY